MLRWSLRTTQRREVVASVFGQDGRGEIQLEAVDEKGDFINFVEANTGVVLPDKTQLVLPLAQVGPGRYRGSFEAAEQGAYLVGVSERKDQKLLGSEVASLVVPYSPEHRALAVNEGLIRDVVTVTGGALPTTPEQAFTQNRRKAHVRVDAWPYLLALALLLFLPDRARRFWLRGGPIITRWRGGAGGSGGSAPTRTRWRAIEGGRRR
jgi:hypothetical protein